MITRLLNPSRVLDKVSDFQCEQVTPTLTSNYGIGRSIHFTIEPNVNVGKDPAQFVVVARPGDFQPLRTSKCEVAKLVLAVALGNQPQSAYCSHIPCSVFW